ncbi:hypothetical protein [Lentzea nigeriaca]|uniref:hypothetical protein n=1 Tax=Lentzea nigeriaca TaxID=1128665 RepID=UPI00195D0F63|nr:hypothetical protein [Lentzea nigeriaca]MBM7861106.1 hypothetical protein [Lentzea nigeriaca]
MASVVYSTLLLARSTALFLKDEAPFARRGRVTSGPHRYEAYHVQIFLLTRYGMRSVRTYLDFATGDTKNGKRQMFPYDAVDSASIGPPRHPDLGLRQRVAGARGRGDGGT